MPSLTLDQWETAYQMAANADTYRNISKTLGFPSEYAFYQYRVAHPVFGKALTLARESSCDILEDEALNVTDKYESAHFARVKLDAICKVLAFRNPTRYGTQRNEIIVHHPDINGSLDRMQQALDATYRDVTPQLQSKKPSDFNDLW